MKALKELLKLYSRCWDTGSIPCAWKQATVIPVPKRGKPPRDPNSYRPISLTPHIGKLYEKMIKIRLEFHLEKHKIIPTSQAGFKKGRGCVDHIVKLTSHIKRSLARKRTTMAAFYDVRRAFDSVWHAKLLHKMSLIGINGKMYAFLQGFSTRTFL